MLYSIFATEHLFFKKKVCFYLTQISVFPPVDPPTSSTLDLQQLSNRLNINTLIDNSLSILFVIQIHVKVSSQFNGITCSQLNSFQSC